ncbi:amidohydrolase family protein, partial [Sulfurimonas sp.]|uniref:amidohydrolase family protein n=1 Tax=Sulfurimonas sp. TaxID=2022749 RepID=UPI0026317DEC
QPSSPVNKEVAFFDAAYGCEALSDALPLYYTKLVKSKMITMPELVKLTVQNPAKALGYEAGEIKEGEKADFILFNINKNYEVKNAQSLYDAEELFGSVAFV